MMAEKILIVGPSWVGDMLMSQSLYRLLKAQQPDCQIDVLAPDWCRAVLERMPEVDNTVAMPVGHGRLQWKVRKQVAEGLKGRYDRALVLPNSLKSALIPWMAGIPVRTGWKGELRYGLLTDLRPLDKKAFPLMVQRYIALAQAPCASGNELPEILRPELQVDADAQAELKTAHGLTDNYIGLCPGAEFGPAKRWPDYHYADLAKQLISAGFQVCIFGSANDQTVSEQILAQLSDAEKQACVDLCGKTSLQAAIDLLAGARAVVSNDSGLMHMAAALGTPLVALYGPTSPDFTPPLTDKVEIIRLIDGYIKIRKGDADQGYHQSMIDISPASVFKAVEQQLS